MTLEEIIFDQILEDSTNLSQTSLRLYLKSNSEKCLFLVDGLEKDKAGILNSKNSEMYRLLHKKIYRKSCVIVSAHPILLNNIGHNLSSFTKVELKGFSDANIEEYIKNYFTGNGNHYTNLIKQLKEHPYIWNLAGIPFFLTSFCFLWNNHVQSKKNLTDTKICLNTIASFWNKYYHEKHDLSVLEIHKCFEMLKFCAGCKPGTQKVTKRGWNSYFYKEQDLLMKKNI